MTAWIPTVKVAEKRGNLAKPAPIDQAAVIIGCASKGTSGALSQLYSNAGSLRTDYGEGPGVTAAEYLLAEYGIPVRFYRAPSTNPGTYDTIDNSGFTGTAVPTVGATTPLNDYEGYIIFTAGTTAVGTAGAKYQIATDGGRTLSKTYALGTGDTISLNIPQQNIASGVQITLQPPTGQLTNLYTALNALRTAELAHYIDVSGSPAIHAASDTTDNTALTAVPTATTPATAVALFNEMKSTLAAHVASAVYHTTADTVAEAALAAIPVAVTAMDAIINLPALITAYNAHRVLVGGGPVHGSADSTNTASASTATGGSIVAGDVIRVLCHAPTFVMADLDAAAVASPAGPLLQTTYDFAHVFVAQPLSASDAGHVSTMLDNLRGVGKIVDATIYTRCPDVSTSETESAWATSIEADFAAFFDDRIEKCEGMPTIVNDPVTAQIWHRPWAYAYFARLMYVERGVWAASPHDGGFTDPNGGGILVALYDSDGNLIGHDEGPSGNVTGLGDATGSGNRFTCLVRGATQQTRGITYTTVPWVAYDPADNANIFNVPQRRIANAIERVALDVSFAALGDKEFYDTDPQTGISTLIPEKQDAIHHVLFDKLTGSEFEDDISNSNDDDPVNGLVRINPVCTASAGTVTVYATIAPKVEGLLVEIDLTYAAQ